MMHFTFADTVNLLLALTGIGIAAFIAVKQHHQVQNVAKLTQDTKAIGEDTKALAQDTKAIGEDTKGIAEDLSDITLKMAGESHKHKVVKALFLQGAKKNKFKCFLPGRYQGKPLPSIEAGDYYALHALQDLLGSEYLELSFQNADGAGEQPGGDAIFLCSPHANAALKSLAPPLNLPSELKKQQSLLGNKLPCWFADRNGKKVISVHDLESPNSPNTTIPSPAEDEYDRAKEVPHGVMHVPTSTHQTDYAILLRLTIKSTGTIKPVRVFVLAGIHQYGTWIAGEFLRRLAIETEELDADKSLFLGNNDDFLAVVYGVFNSKLLAVQHLGIHDGCVWTGNNGDWTKVSGTSHNSRATRSSLNSQRQNHSTHLPNAPGRRSSPNIGVASQT